jgi:hypothetical protein
MSRLWREEARLILRRFKQAGRAEETGFCGHCAKKLLEIATTPSNVRGRKSWRRTEKRRNASD